MIVKLKKLSVHGKAYRLNLLDTAGQERFRTLSNSYYRGAHGVILVYDISNRDSFLSMERWYEEAENNSMPGAIMYLVCTQVSGAQAR
jgi:Ras-related protein Rab-18